MRQLITVIAVLLVAGIACFADAADNWPRFRGPNGAGISDARTIPTKWGDGDYLWKVALPGTGVSSPVVWGQKLFVACADEATARHTLMCVNTGDGSTAWKAELAAAAHHHHQFNAFASSTPAVDEQRVYYTWTTPEHYNVVAFDHAGKEVWRRDLGPFAAEHGGGASPIVYKDMLIVPDDQDGESFIYALDCATGKTKWQTARLVWKTSYATPCVYEPADGKAQIIVSSKANGITALDPQDGKMIWESGDLFRLRTVMSPVLASGMIFASCGEGGNGKMFVAITPGDANGGKSRVAYQLDKGIPYVPVPVAVGDLLFVVTDGGIASCLDAKSGQVKWQERLGGPCFSSPVCVNGNVYSVNRSGEVFVFRATAEKLDVLGRSTLGEGSQATPAVSGGRMFFRTTSHLMCIGDKAATAAR